MELVSTSKLKRAQDRVVAARPYAEALSEVIADLVTPELAERFPLLRRPAPPGKGGPRRAALILLTSNRGLAGAFNSNLIKEARRRIEALEAEGLRGRAARRRARRASASSSIVGRKWALERIDIGDKPTADHAAEIAEPLIAAYAAGSSRAWTWCRPSFLSALADPAGDDPHPAGASRRRRRTAGGRPSGTTSSRRARTRSWSSCCRSTCGTWSIAGWWRPPRRSTARGAPR